MNLSKAACPSLSAIYAAILFTFVSSVNAQTSSLGTVTIEGEGDQLGTGQIVPEDSVKSRSTVTRAAIEKQLSTSNPFQALENLPGVFSYSQEATGLWGGSIAVRGFQGEQLGLTINNVPVNDSGNYAVYPQEYADAENTCSSFVTQGATDLDSPHIGATGGNIGVVTCKPTDTKSIFASVGFGSEKLRRAFIRLNTGKFSNDQAKLFISYSQTEADKWTRGDDGIADRKHLDAGFEYKPNSNFTVSGTFLYNYAVNNNFRQLTRGEIAANGYDYDYETTFRGRAVTAGVADDERNRTNFYGLHTNPFENLIASVQASWKLSDVTELKIQPYYWFGYGTGGPGGQTQTESNATFTSASNTTRVAQDLNGDGDTLDTVLVRYSSLTDTNRPGVTVTLNHLVGNHFITTGLWYEKADHVQTGPMQRVNSSGFFISDFNDENAILRPDGSKWQRRDHKTVSTAMQFFVQDSMSLAKDKLNVTFGLRTPQIKREVTVRAAEGESQPAFRLSQTDSDVLPQLGLRYAINDSSQVFANLAKNFRAPPNFAFTGNSSNIRVVNGIGSTVVEVKPETAINLDIGLRRQLHFGTLSATAFFVDFKDRQANFYDPVVDRNIYKNSGGVEVRGLEIELGSKPVRGFSVYGSATFTESEIKDNIRTSGTSTVASKGNEFPLTPKTMFALVGQYAQGPALVQLRGKYTGDRYSDLANLDKVDGYTVIDLSAAYKLGNSGFFRNPTLRLNVLNLLDEEYLNPTGIRDTYSASSTRYYRGAPRFYGVTFSSEF